MQRDALDLRHLLGQVQLIHPDSHPVDHRKPAAVALLQCPVQIPGTVSSRIGHFKKASVVQGQPGPAPLPGQGLQAEALGLAGQLGQIPLQLQQITDKLQPAIPLPALLQGRAGVPGGHKQFCCTQAQQLLTAPAQQFIQLSGPTVLNDQIALPFCRDFCGKDLIGRLHVHSPQ